jgi:predicted enzyme related to lactoylglutathione lyase
MKPETLVMSENVKKFVWYDLMTSDLKAAGDFYSKVVGWGTMDSGIVERPYHIFTKGQSFIGGLMPVPPDAAGAPPAWMGYIGVDNVDAYVKRVTDAGGQVRRAPEDIPNGIGRFAIVADPHGVTFALFSSPAGDPPTETLNELGHIGWHELYAGDLESAWGFYSGLFGWEKSSGFDMGPMGEYRIFTTGGSTAGGMMTKMPQSPMPFWIFYFNVDEINAAVERIKQAGGQIFNGPMEVPGGQWIVQAFDPQGAMFALVTPRP